VGIVLLAFIVTAFAGLSGCASTSRSMFVQSKASDAATIQARWLKESSYVWEGYSLLSVDDRFVSVGFFGDPNTAATRVDPGSRRLVVKAVFNRGLRTGPFEAYVPLNADLKPSSRYEIDGQISGAVVEVWLGESSSKERVTEIGTASYSSQPKPPVVIPLFIPVNTR
jgi:hypothetical protein